MIAVTELEFRQWREEAQKKIDERMEELSKLPRESDLGFGVGINWDTYFALKVNEWFRIKPGETK